MTYDTDGRIRWDVKPWGPLNKTGRLVNAHPPRTQAEYFEEKRSRNDEFNPGWRDQKHDNGQPKYSPDGTMLDERGNRSIFDDVDE